MQYLRLEEVKNYIHDWSDDEENTLILLCNAAEEIVAQHIRRPLSDVIKDNDGVMPNTLLLAMTMIVGNWFDNRDAVTSESLKEIPLAYEYLLSPYVAYENTKI